MVGVGAGVSVGVIVAVSVGIIGVTVGVRVGEGWGLGEAINSVASDPCSGVAWSDEEQPPRANVITTNHPILCNKADLKPIRAYYNPYTLTSAL
jgi:hypothetical protein